MCWGDIPPVEFRPTGRGNYLTEKEVDKRRILTTEVKLRELQRDPQFIAKYGKNSGPNFALYVLLVLVLLAMAGCSRFPAVMPSNLTVQSMPTATAPVATKLFVPYDLTSSTQSNPPSITPATPTSKQTSTTKPSTTSLDEAGGSSLIPKGQLMAAYERLLGKVQHRVPQHNDPPEPSSQPTPSTAPTSTSSFTFPNPFHTMPSRTAFEATASKPTTSEPTTSKPTALPPPLTQEGNLGEVTVYTTRSFCLAFIIAAVCKAVAFLFGWAGQKRAAPEPATATAATNDTVPPPKKFTAPTRQPVLPPPAKPPPKELAQRARRRPRRKGPLKDRLLYKGGKREWEESFLQQVNRLYNKMRNELWWHDQGAYQDVITYYDARPPVEGYTELRLLYCKIEGIKLGIDIRNAAEREIDIRNALPPEPKRSAALPPWAKRPLKSDAQLLDALVAPNNDDASVMIGSPVKDAHKDRSLASFGSPVPLPPVRQPLASTGDEKKNDCNNTDKTAAEPLGPISTNIPSDAPKTQESDSEDEVELTMAERRALLTAKLTANRG